MPGFANRYTSMPGPDRYTSMPGLRASDTGHKAFVQEEAADGAA